MDGLTHLDDDELIVRSPDDREAFGVFYDRHVAAMLRYLRRQGLSREDAVDLTAEVFAAALAASHRYRPDRAPSGAWLFGIARKKLAKTRRRGVVERVARAKLGIARISFSDEALDRVEERLDAARRINVNQLDLLSSAERGAIQARVIDGRSYGEIAADEGTTSAAIRQRVHRGLAKLGELEGEPG